MDRFAYTRFWTVLGISLIVTAGNLKAEDPWVIYEGKEGPGKGKNIVLISGDEEYRSEEALPMLGKILAEHHGFKCTVLFAIDKKTGVINPIVFDNIPGLQSLESADLMLIFTRFRDLPDEQMKYIDDFVNSGKPILGLRTSTHGFQNGRRMRPINRQIGALKKKPELSEDEKKKLANLEAQKKKMQTSPYRKYGGSKEWKDGFGLQVLGEKWSGHYGHHKREATRGIINEEHKDHPMLKDVADIFGPTDVYGAPNVPKDAQILVWGQVLAGMKPGDKPNEKKKLQPLCWTKTFKGSAGKVNRVFATTMGASVDFKSAGLRRIVVNACYWGMGLEDKIPEKSNVDIVGEFKPTFYGFGSFKKNVKPSDLKL